MKKLIYLTLLGLVFTACNPMDDIYSEIDSEDSAIVGDATYTISDDDYETLGLTYGSFSSEDDAKTLIPSLLTDMYPVWGKNSSVLVSYQLYVGSAEGVSDYTSADVYSLANSDYPGASDNAVGFYPSEDPEDYISDILNANIDSPVEGQHTLVKYKQYIGEPVVGISNYFDADFKTEGTLLDFDAISVVGDDQVWVETESYGAKMTGFVWPDAIENEDWLVSQEIDLTSQTNVTFQVNQAINYANGELDLMNILVSTDYTGDVSTATWTTIELTTAPAGSSWSFVESEEYDFSAFEGETIHIALKYESTTTTAATWEVAQILLKTPGVEGDTESTSIYYTYNGTEWEVDEDVYYLSADDFDSMGEGSGEPGQYNNFSSSISPDDYLPTFLSIKYPYASDGDELIVTYPYYSSTSGAQTRGNLYTVVDGAWAGYESTITTSLQFGHDGTTWVPDNTIKYTLTGADYVYIADALEGNADFADVSLTNLAKYSDYDYNWSDDQITASLVVFLNYLDPTAEDGQKYVITYLLYDNGLNDISVYFIKTDGEWVINE